MISYRTESWVWRALLVLLLVALLASIGMYLLNTSRQVERVRSQTASSPTAKTYHPKKIVAVGDIACTTAATAAAVNDPARCQQARTYTLARDQQADAALLLGDLQYDSGTLEQFQMQFSKSWGQLMDIAYPTPGNHEYRTPGASAYFSYFTHAASPDVERGYYSFELGPWHLISLNSNCDQIGGCGAGSAQLAWLEQDLATNAKRCTLAFWHHPRFTSGEYYKDAVSKGRSDDFWQVLTAHRADVVLNGHDHIYERFAPQFADGTPNAGGLQQFTVGTGGKELYAKQAVASGSQKIVDDQYGVLLLELYGQAYRWQFKTVGGQVMDTGYRECR